MLKEVAKEVAAAMLIFIGGPLGLAVFYVAAKNAVRWLKGGGLRAAMSKLLDVFPR